VLTEIFKTKICSTPPIGRGSNYVLSFRSIYVRTISKIFIKTHRIVFESIYNSQPHGTHALSYIYIYIMYVDNIMDIMLITTTAIITMHIRVYYYSVLLLCNDVQFTTDRVQPLKISSWFVKMCHSCRCVEHNSISILWTARYGHYNIIYRFRIYIVW